MRDEPWVKALPALSSPRTEGEIKAAHHSLSLPVAACCKTNISYE